jgi:hypothetical protein
MSMSTTKCRGAVAPTLQQHHRFSLRSIPQIVRRQRVSPATMAWNFLTPDLAAIDIAEVGNRRTISTKHAPATIILYGLTVADRPGPVIPRDGTPAGKRPLAPDGFESMHRTPQYTRTATTRHFFLEATILRSWPPVASLSGRTGDPICYFIDRRHHGRRKRPPRAQPQHGSLLGPRLVDSERSAVRAIRR